MPFARRVRRGERVSGEDGAYRGNGTSFNSETRRNGGRKAVVMEYADAAACAASDQPTPRGRKLPMRHTQLVPTGCRLIARPGPWPGRHRQVSRGVIRALRVSVSPFLKPVQFPPSPPAPRLRPLRLLALSVLESSHHSTRNAVSGSKRVARHDGIRQAAMVTVVSSATIPTKVTGSVGGIWATTLASA